MFKSDKKIALLSVCLLRVYNLNGMQGEAPEHAHSATTDTSLDAVMKREAEIFNAIDTVLETIKDEDIKAECIKGFKVFKDKWNTSPNDREHTFGDKHNVRANDRLLTLEIVNQPGCEPCFVGLDVWGNLEVRYGSIMSHFTVWSNLKIRFDGGAESKGSCVTLATKVDVSSWIDVNTLMKVKEIASSWYSDDFVRVAKPDSARIPAERLCIP
jgi:hypothetical protein